VIVPDTDDSELIIDPRDDDPALPRGVLLAEAVASPLPGGVPVEQEIAGAALGLLLSSLAMRRTIRQKTKESNPDRPC
jgi:hypothetical protein